MLLLWLQEKVTRRELTPAEADKILKDQSSAMKNWLAPFKDAAGSAKLLYKMAKDFGSWRGAKVSFTRGANGVEYVTFKGWPNDRGIIRGTRYRVDNPSIVELQIGKSGVIASAKDSARFGVYFVVAVDVFEYLMGDKRTLGSLLGSLTYDIPGVLLSSAAGALAAGSAFFGAVTIGPIIVAFAVGFGVGWLLSELDDELQITSKLGKMYDNAFVKLADIWDDLGDAAEGRYKQMVNSRFIHDLDQNVRWLSDRIGRQADIAGGRIASFW